MPFRRGTIPQFSAGAATGLSTETVDADGTRRRWEEDGFIEQAVANTARIQDRGMLPEGVRMNTFQHSEDFANTWGPVRAAVVPNVAISPDGTENADKLIEDGTAGATHFIGQTEAIVDTQPSVYSIFAKADGRSEIRMRFFSRFPNDPGAFFNLATGEVGTVDADIDDAGTEDVGGGWYRCWIAAAANATGNVTCYVYLSSGSETFVYDGDGASGVYLWGGQLEEQATFPSSYIPTVAAAVQRAAEDLDIDNTAEVHCTADAGSLAVAVTPPFDGANVGADATVLDTTDGTPDGVLVFFDQSNAGKLTATVYSGGAPVATLVAAAAPVAFTTYVVVVTWEANSFALYIDGVQDATDTAGAAPAAVDTRLYLGQSRGNAAQGYCEIEYLLSWNRALATSEALAQSDQITAWAA